MSRTAAALMASGLVAAGLVSFAGGASSAPVAGGAVMKAAAHEITALPNVEAVRWRGRGGYRGGWGYGGFAAGALLGSGLAYRYYAPPPYYAPYYAQPYGPPPTYYAEDSGDVGYCMRRFKSYDPRSGTYLGYDDIRHPCP